MASRSPLLHQMSLLDDHRPTERVWLDGTSWVDHQPGWARDPDGLLAHLLDELDFAAHRRLLFDRWVDEPRLSANGPPGPHPELDRLRTELSQRYQSPFEGWFCNLYRDGHDAVAWHRDRIHRYQAQPLVAILVLGARRPFLLRPRGAGSSHRLVPGGGDLLVMGGRSQHDWEHCVPRARRIGGLRLSVTIRSAGGQRVASPVWRGEGDRRHRSGSVGVGGRP